MYEQTVRETEKLLQERGLKQLSSQQKDLLKGQTEGITSADHTVFHLICKYARLVPLVSLSVTTINPISICHLTNLTYHGFVPAVFGRSRARFTGSGLRGPIVSGLNSEILSEIAWSEHS